MVLAGNRCLRWGEVQSDSQAERKRLGAVPALGDDARPGGDAVPASAVTDDCLSQLGMLALRV